MVLRRLKDIYEKRRGTLTHLLKTSPKMDKDRRREISAAITEIETLIKTIDTLREEEVEENRLLEVKATSSYIDNLPFVRGINDKVKMRFDSSNTKKNLLGAFNMKCASRTKYELFARIARDEGYEHIAHVLLDTANNEKEQANIILEYMKENNDTAHNLRDASEMERKNHEYYYGTYGKVASEEKYPHIAEFFEELSHVEVEHERRFLKLLKNMHEKKVFRRETAVRWRCKNCGYVTEAKEAPLKCKVCRQPRAHFELYNESY